MMRDPITRLAAANPVPSDVAFTAPQPLVRPHRRHVLALAIVAAVLVPAGVAAGLGGLFDFSNQGTAVPADNIDLSHVTGLASAMQELGFPSTLQRLGTVNGVTFFAARRGDGNYCFAIESAAAKGVGCDLDGTFPSVQRPVMIFPPLRQFAGFAADDVASVAGVDATGNTVVSAPAHDNLFAAAVAGPFPTVSAIEARDADGHVLWRWNVPGR